MSQILFRLKRGIRKASQDDEHGPITVLNPKFTKATLEELLDEIVERASCWDHCAIGERFEVPFNNEDEAVANITAEGLSQHQANVLLEQGREFDTLCHKTRESYRMIQAVQKESSVKRELQE